MAESTTYALRGFKGGAVAARIPGGLSTGVTGVVAADDLSTWAGATAAGPIRVMVFRTGATPEEIEVSSVSGNNLTISARGLEGTSDTDHGANATIEIVSSPRDFREANKLVNAIFGLSGLTAGDLLEAASATSFRRVAKSTAWRALAMKQDASGAAYASGYPLFVFADATARDAAITSPAEGMFAWLTGTDALTYYNGTAWAAFSSGGGSSSFVGAILVNNADQTVNNGADGNLAFQTETADTDAYHDAGANTRITIPSGKAGKYRLTASVYWTNGATVTGNVQIRFKKNGGGLFNGFQFVRTVELEASQSQSRALTAVETAVAGDYFEVAVSNNSGSNLTVEGAGGECHFSIEYLGA